MRNAILQMPERRTTIEQRRVRRAAIRQLERADIYVAAVAHMDLGDAAVERLLRDVRADLQGLRRHLGDQRERLGL
jgi:hypothetical protein